MNGFAKGMIAGLAVGATVGIMLVPGSRKRAGRMMRANADKAVRAVSDMIESFQVNFTNK